ncbi:hypothetical protein SAY86_024958 [Trapa natans]|uniref:BZIP domain-containing protein n=1 Tax=Trapa natans TaxID=22666 RepID=A0AAN7RK97_TRANT|nr:hypothetical protein SAY86_024958 [Trapa natans]
MAQLPPKIPTLTPLWPPDFAFHGSHQKLPAPPFVTLANIPSAAQGGNDSGRNYNNPSWVDEFLDFSQARRGAHRRSASDSIAFLDSGLLFEDVCRLDAGAGSNVASAGPGSSNADSGSDFDRFDDEQFMSMFNDEISPRPSSNNNNTGGAATGLGSSSPNPSTSSDNNSVNEEKQHSPRMPDRHHQMEQKITAKMKTEAGEEHSHCEEETAGQSGNATGTPAGDMGGSSEKIVDPKRVKRILANRQSAQRSRVRKLQYISELERSVTSLQAEVSVLSPRVTFLDHQRLLLNVDNSALKQRIAALAQDKIFKDAHQEALKREIERLRQIYHQQSHKGVENSNFAPASPPPSGSDVMTGGDRAEEQQLLAS